MASEHSGTHVRSSRFFGGPERQMLELARALAPDVNSSFFSFSESGLCREFLGRAQENGFPACELQHDTPRLIAAAKELQKRFDALRVSIVFCHGYKANLLGRWATFACKIPAVSVSRGWTGENRKVLLYEAIDRRLLRLMDNVICVSHGQARLVRRAGD